MKTPDIDLFGARTEDRLSVGDMATKVSTGPLASARLQQLGFSPPALVREALEFAGGTARSVTPWHPAGYAGTRMWAETTFSLSMLGRECDWQHEAVKGVDLVTNHQTGTAIIVTAGDAATGFEKYRPETRYERPEMVQAIVNGTLDTLWDAQGDRNDWQVWFLLHNVAIDSDVVPAELSLPAGIGASGRVTRWVERVIIPAGGSLDSQRMPVAEPETPLEPLVEVRRRVS